MTMQQTSGWMQALGNLDCFVAAHPEISVSKTGLGVPKQCREAFYDKVADACAAFAREVSGPAGFADRAVAELADVTGRLSKALGVAVVLPAELRAFCNDRFAGCTQAFTSNVLSYVQGNVDGEGLIAQATQSVAPAMRRLTKAAYEAWLYYSVIEALKPTAAYVVDTPDQKHVVAEPADVLEMGAQRYSATLRLPEAVYECADGSLWAVKMELANEVDFYGSKPLRRRDYSVGGDSRGTVGRRYLLLYRVSSLDAVPLTADRDRVLTHAPTAMVAAVWPDDLNESLYERGTLQRVMTLGPRFGALVAALDGCGDAVREDAGFCQAKATVFDAAFDTNDVTSFLQTLQ